MGSGSYSSSTACKNDSIYEKRVNTRARNLHSATTYELMALSTHLLPRVRLESILYVEKFVVKVLNCSIITTRWGVQRSETL